MVLAPAPRHFLSGQCRKEVSRIDVCSSPSRSLIGCCVVAMAPSNVTVVTINSSALEVMWAADSAPFPDYLVYYNLTSTADLSLVEVWPSTSPDPQSPFSVELGNLKPFTKYSIIVMATRVCGSNQSAVITGVTGESLPTVPLNLVVAAALPTRVKVQWSAPACPNGNVTHYNVSNWGGRGGEAVEGQGTLVGGCERTGGPSGRLWKDRGP